MSNLGKDVTEIEEDVVMLPGEAQKFYRKLRRAGILFWVINLTFVATPLTIFMFGSFWSNIGLNIILNQFWAYGNLFLIGNTLFMMFQSLMAVPLIYEIPFILQYIKPLRFVSLFAGFVYNIMYWLNLFDVLYISFAVAPPVDKV